MPLDLFSIKFAAAVFVNGEPLRRFVRAQENQIGVFLRHSEMRQASGGKCAAAHKAVVRSPRPTRFESQTSDSETQTQKRPDHLRLSKIKPVNGFVLDFDVRMPPRDFKQCAEQPLHADLPNSVIGGFKIQIRRDLAPPVLFRRRNRLIELLRPSFVEFVHCFEHKTGRREMQFRDIIFVNWTAKTGNQKIKPKTDFLWFVFFNPYLKSLIISTDRLPVSSFFMKYLVFLPLVLLVSLNVFAQKPKPAGKPSAAKTAKAEANTGSEKAGFEKAAALADPAQRAEALINFVKKFPQSAEKSAAQELISVADAQIGGENLKNNQITAAARYFKLALQNSPSPVSDKLFSQILLQIPSALFFGGAREAALETARLLEAKADGNARQTLGLATFYLGIENADQAIRLANRAAALEPNLTAAYQTLGIANRLNFQPEEAVAAYAKALELDPNSTVSKRSLAEMSRAAGKFEQSIALYREILAQDAADAAAQTGLALALFDAEKQTAAEIEMAKALAQNPNDLPLLVGAAYWYAAHNDGAKAIEMGNHAVTFEPRYVWAHIALARGFLQQKRPLEAERTLLEAKQYGNFPTLSYELAAARLQAGFYREAAETLKNDFTVGDGTITAKLGGRVETKAENFIQLLTPERRAGIFEPLAADTMENADRLKNLLELMHVLETSNTDESQVARPADAFIAGADASKFYRQLFVARRLLEAKPDSPKILQIARSLVGKSDAALNAPNSSSAILAEALYDSRQSAALKNEVVLVPDVPRPTLSAILRGEIEEITGWAYFQQNKPDDAVVHLKRAVSVLPEKSSFWRSSMWRLGSALQNTGKENDALDAYLKSYPADAPSAVKYSVVESLYRKVNGSDAGLEAKIGAKPTMPAAEPETPVLTALAVPKIASAPESAMAAALPPETPAPEPEISIEKPAATVSTAPVELIKPNTNLPNNAAKNEPPTAPPTVAEIAAPEAKQTPLPPALPDDSPSTGKPVVIIAETAPKKFRAKPAPPISQISSVPANNDVKPLFEPIIIQVPKTETVKSPKPAATENPSSQTPPTPVGTQTSPVGSEPADALKTKFPASSPDIFRPRVIVTENISNAAETPRCTLKVSQENVSIINSGGSLSVIVSFENPADAAEIKAFSSSPQDVGIEMDADIGSSSGRSLYIIKSLSAKSGEYKMSFETACGSKQINVRVR